MAVNFLTLLGRIYIYIYYLTDRFQKYAIKYAKWKTKHAQCAHNLFTISSNYVNLLYIIVNMSIASL